MPPNWLPRLLIVDPWTQNTFEELYAVFTEDFKTTRPTLDGAEVWFFPEMEDGKELIFWHLTQRDDRQANDRLPDFARCARLCWIRAIIDHSNHPDVLCWDYIEADKSIRTYLWLRDDDYVIVLKRMSNGSRRLITAYCVDYQSKRRTLQAKYEKRAR